MIDAFIVRWRGIVAARGPGKFEVDATHPLRFIVGVNDRGEPIIFVIVKDKPPIPELSGVIDVERRWRANDEKWTLALSLTDTRFLEAYLQFATDLVNRTADARTEAEGICTLLAVVSEWKRLLARGSTAPLSEPALRGLVAELWFGFRMLPREAPASKIALAWQGPYGSHQDYVFPLGPRYEVKSRRVDSETIHISSPEQLDADDLTLATVTLVDIEPGAADAINLPTLVEAVRSALAPDALLALDRGLDAIQVDPGDSHYADLCYVVTDCVEYQVPAEFPSIRRSALPGSIVAATYEISISAIQEFVGRRWQPERAG